MDEATFWKKLEYRICGEFVGLPEQRHRYFWCDGFIPYDYYLEEPTPQIAGRAWIVDGQAQEQWDFVLYLPGSVLSKELIDWESLLPPENRTRWMCFDENRKRLEIDPAAAVPDLL